ncbi:MAG: hypothetical protein U5L06_01350 [Rhodovibrio sp.]|nr:hypothetical protein [Rhodovibrio sp.]
MPRRPSRTSATSTHDYFTGTDHPDDADRATCRSKHVKLADGSTALVATVHDLFVANYGVDRGLGGEHVAERL